MQLKSNLIVRPDRDFINDSPQMALTDNSKLTLLSFVNTPFQQVDALPLVHILIPPLVHRTQTNIHTHTMRGVWYNSLGTEVIDPVQVGF